MIDNIDLFVKIHNMPDRRKLFRTALKEKIIRKGLGRIAIHAFDKSDGINARIELTCMLQMQGRFFVSQQLHHWQEAYQMATWDEHAYEQGEWARTDNGSYPVDCLDSAVYAFYPFARSWNGRSPNWRSAVRTCPDSS